MASEGIDGASVPDPARLMAKAAASLAGSLATSGLRQTLGLLAGNRPDVADHSWIERVLEPFRQALGSLGGLDAMVGMMPRVLERIGRLVGAPAGPQLLFRARRQNDPKLQMASLTLTDAELRFHDFVSCFDKARHSRVTPALAKRLEPIRKGYPAAREALRKLIDDPRRTDLPRLLDELKHEVRADRMQGFVKVHDALSWLLQSKGTDFSAAYALLEQLSDLLGESCLRELRRRRADDALLSADADDAWLKPLRDCFATFGHPLSKLVSVVECGPGSGVELLVMDHHHDRWFQVRPGAGATETDPWCGGGEVHATAAGHDYLVGQRPYKLPLRDHDAAQGFATWSVDARLVQESRDCFSIESGLDMRALDIGGNRTPVALFFVHHRDTDAGAYFELGLGCFVAPHKDPLSVGFAMLGSILVSTQQGKDVGATIWGYRKESEPDGWTVRYRPDHLKCSVRLEHATLHLQLPRGGLAWASALPMLLYTRKPADRGGQWHRSALMRFTRGDSLRSAGSGVQLTVEIVPGMADRAFAHPLLGELYRLGLIDADGRLRSQPLHAGWAEHVSTQLGAPLPVPLADPEFD